MTNSRQSLSLVVGDADSLIALLYKHDINHKQAENSAKKLSDRGVSIVYPNTAIAEAISVLYYKHSNPHIAAFLQDQVKQGGFEIEYVTEEIMQRAAHLFDPFNLKKHSYFDAIVAATAQSLKADAIFSFDEWYPSVGLRLVSELL